MLVSLDEELCIILHYCACISIDVLNSFHCHNDSITHFIIDIIVPAYTQPPKTNIHTHVHITSSYTYTHTQTHMTNTYPYAYILFIL